MKLYDHQRKIILEDPKQCGLFLGTGSGKTRIALSLATGRTLVIAPKTQVEDKNWERELAIIRKENQGKREKIKSLTVISKEQFRLNWKNLKPDFNTIIIDECHTALGVTPNTRRRARKEIPKASQIFEAVEEFLSICQPERLYLCTATIVKSPMTVWAARWLLGKAKRKKIDSFLHWRNTFYTKLPMPGREVYAPRRDSKTKDSLAAYVRMTGYVGRLEDYFDVPEQTYRTIHVGLSAQQKDRIKELPLEFPDKLVLIGKRHQVENGVLAGDEYTAPETFDNAKIEKILELALEFPKMVIFAKYSAQIRDIEAALRKAKYPVYVLTGETKDRGGLIGMANKGDGIFIAQAQISAGWELPTYPVMIFASRTYSFVDYSQALGRIQRANYIKKNLYINLVVKDGIDEAVDRALTNKQDFDERIYLGV